MSAVAHQYQQYRNSINSSEVVLHKNSSIDTTQWYRQQHSSIASSIASGISDSALVPNKSSVVPNKSSVVQEKAQQYKKKLSSTRKSSIVPEKDQQYQKKLSSTKNILILLNSNKYWENKFILNIQQYIMQEMNIF